MSHPEKKALQAVIKRSPMIRERFDIGPILGEGGFGIVCEAYDRERQARVALKSLHRVEPTALYRFKREFRTLADISHRNLVQLYELIADGEHWFMTMEFVEGEHFLDGISPYDSDELMISGDSETLEGIVPETGPLPRLQRPVSFEPELVRASLGQIAAGLSALHERGILHRDIKPSNVLIDTNGRVVILDFGMVEELRPARGSQKMNNGFVGTPHYASPEQAMGHDATSASDWYSVGVMLHEALTGRYPIDGRTVVQILLKKQSPHVPPVESFPVDSPHDMIELCRALLRHNPAERPTAGNITRRLSTSEVFAASSQSSDEIFVGRVEELAELDHARRKVRTSRRPVVVNVSGSSGMGKSALVRHFCDRLREQVVVLQARCYENESVPYKAVDGLVDDISRHLTEIPKSERDAVLEGVDVEALARLFPIMTTFLDDPDAEMLVAPDRSQQRQRSFQALRALIDAMCDHWSLVLWIDDAQWGDRDSAALIAELLRGPDPPPVLWIATYRSEDVEASSYLPVWMRTLEEHAEHIDVADLRIGALNAEDSHALAASLVDDHDEGILETITSEARGHPFFIDELARHREFRRRVDSTITSLDDFIRYRFDRLEMAERQLLETVAVAGQPLEWGMARDIARLGDSAPGVFAVLRNQRLIRVNTRDSGDFIETYHDRIRETVRDALAPDRRGRYHLRIAETLDQGASNEFDRLSFHYREGGESETAADFARRAAFDSMSSLAFEKAVAEFEEAMRLKRWDRDEEFEMLEQLGRANGFLARGNEAAAAYRDASRLTDDPARAIDLRRESAEQLIRCGQFERGMSAMSNVMEQIGLSIPSRRWLLPAIGWKALMLALRGNTYTISDEPISRLEETRLDALWGMANMLATIDVRGGAYFQLVNLTESLDSGDATAIGRALGLQAVHDAATPRNRDRSFERLADAAKLVEVSRQPELYRSWVAFATGLVDYMRGEFTTALEHFQASIDILEAAGLASQWEIASVELYALQCFYFVGDLVSFTELTERMLDDAERSQDYLHLIAAGLWGHVSGLIADDPDGAGEGLDQAIAGWADQDYHLQDFWYLKGRANVAIYQGDGRRAHQMLLDEWSDVGSAMILRTEIGLVTAWDVRLRAAIARGVEGDVRIAQKEVQRATRAFLRWKPAYGIAILQLHSAQADLLAGGHSGAELLAGAEAACEAAGLRTWTLAARALLGRVIGGDRGAALEKKSYDDLAQEGVANPERFVGLYVPAIRTYDRLLN